VTQQQYTQRFVFFERSLPHWL